MGSKFCSAFETLLTLKANHNASLIWSEPFTLLLYLTLRLSKDFKIRSYEYYLSIVLDMFSIAKISFLDILYEK